MAALSGSLRRTAGADRRCRWLIGGRWIAERHEFADFLDTLDADQRTAPTLCEAWTVHQVVAHVISYDEIGPLALAATLVRGAFRPGRVNDLRLQAVASRPPEQLVACIRSNLRPHGLASGFGGGIGMSDCLIHHQDIRRALGLPRSIPPECLREALDIALRVPVVPAKAIAGPT